MTLSNYYWTSIKHYSYCYWTIIYWSILNYRGNWMKHINVNLLYFLKIFFDCDHQLNILNTFCNMQFLTCFSHRIILITFRLFNDSMSLSGSNVDDSLVFEHVLQSFSFLISLNVNVIIFSIIHNRCNQMFRYAVRDYPVFPLQFIMQSTRMRKTCWIL